MEKRIPKIFFEYYFFKKDYIEIEMKLNIKMESLSKLFSLFY